MLNNVDKNWVRHVAMAEVLRDQLGDSVFATTIYHRSPYDAAVYLNKALWQNIAWRKSADEMELFVRETISRIDALEGVTTELNYII